MNRFCHSSEDDPKSLLPSVLGTKLLSNLPVAVIVSLVALPRSTLPLATRLPEISTLSLISIRPPVESRTRLPEVVSMVLSLVIAI